jgi:hypothetical protein
VTRADGKSAGVIDFDAPARSFVLAVADRLFVVVPMFLATGARAD